MISRQAIIPLLHTVMAAPITSAIHGVPSEVPVDVEDGLKHASAVNLDHVQTVETRRLRRYIGHLSQERMAQVCAALAVATGCPEADS